MAELTLITGGARSGKSSLALELAEAKSSPGRRIFVATCPVIDPELSDRVARHCRERSGRGWQTVEEELDLASVFASSPHQATIVVDCLTLWVNNLMYRAGEEGFGESEMAHRCRELILALEQFPGRVILVTNEVGLGVVPEYPAARLYRDLVGRCNRQLAAAAQRVILVSCGLPLYLKGWP